MIGPTSHHSPALMQPSAQRETRKQNGPGSPKRPRSLHLTPLPSTRARPLLGGSGPGRREAPGPRGMRAGTQISFRAISFQFLALPGGKCPRLRAASCPAKRRSTPPPRPRKVEGPRPQDPLLGAPFGEVFTSRARRAPSRPQVPAR